MGFGRCRWQRCSHRDSGLAKGKSEKVTDRTGTGDSKNITGYVIGIVAAALILVIGFCWKKKRK